MATPDRFNDYILKSVKMIAADRAGGGYDINSYFTRDLKYGSDCCIKANHPTKTMCVAAVSEVIIEALNIYFAETGDEKPFQDLPIRSWTGGTAKDIRAHIFMYKGSGSRGTAHALSRFGVGKEVAFEDLIPGDFINLNRARSGHAVVFLGFINKDYKIEPAYSNRVVGFHYFSSQGKKSDDAGFAYRWAFFGNLCLPAPPEKKRDCGVIFSDNPTLLNSGYMLHPRSWKVDMGLDKLENIFINPEAAHTRTKPLESLSQELEPADLSRLDGITTD